SHVEAASGNIRAVRISSSGALFPFRSWEISLGKTTGGDKEEIEAGKAPGATYYSGIYRRPGCIVGFSRKSSGFPRRKTRHRSHVGRPVAWILKAPLANCAAILGQGLRQDW